MNKMSLRSEIYSQPENLSQLLDRFDEVESIAAEIRKRDIKYVFLAARGTSDNAGLYAKYLWAEANKLPTALAAPSLFSIYQSPPNLSNALVVGISQSGQSPDIVSVIEEGKRQGVMTLAITNDASSPLSRSSDFKIDLGAGVETAVAATKTYTAELLAIAMLSVALKNDSERIKELGRLPEFVGSVLELDANIQRMVERYRYMQQCVILGRGYNYATAYEWSLKMKELAYVLAVPYSSADFQHGPIAIVFKGFPVLAVIPKGKVFKNMYDQLVHLRKEYQVELLVVSNDHDALSLANSPINIPLDLPEWLSPIVAIVPAQLYSYHLTVAKDLDPESPRGLTKVTLTE